MAKRYGWMLFGYAIFLLLCGIAASRISDAPRLSSLGGGIGGFVLMSILALLYSRNVLWAQQAAKAALGVFSLTFMWRAAERWLELAVPESESTALASLLTLMFAVSAVLATLVLKRR